MKSAILIDTGANVLDIKDENVFFIPISIIASYPNKQEKEHKDVIEISQDQLNQLMVDKIGLKTSLPPPGLVIAKLDELFKEYDRVIVLTLSSGISGYFNSLDTIKEQYQDKQLVCIDSRSVSTGILWIVDAINELLKSNPSNQEIIDLVANKSKKIVGGVIVNDLNQLIRGGRVSKLKGFIAKALKLKIIIKWDGKLEFFDKTPSLDSAINKLLDTIDHSNQWRVKGIKKIDILTDFSNEAQLNSLKQSIKQKINQDVEIGLSYLPGCIYAHVGVNNFAILIEANDE